MTDSGPTTTGSIVAKLHLNRDQWNAMMAATRKDVAEFEGSDPNIHIDTNANQAIAELGATAAAADALGAKQEDLGRKTRRTTDETIRANEANRTAFTRIGAIVTAVALLVPLLAPVGAAAIGVGSAFLGMGAAGVLALIGIHNEIEKGTVVGASYRDGIDSLKNSMGTLSRTAAVNMLTSFQKVVNETRAALPQLNTQVGQFSTLLGRSGGNLFTGTINALRVLNPLFLTAGIYLQSLTEGFRRWTEGSGIQDFGAYALGMLPTVVDVLGKLSAMVMHILQALIPLGTIGLAALSGIANAINAIPVEVLSQLIVTITWGAIAFKAWGFIAPMLAGIATSMGAVGAATAIATGPIGWIVAGLAALAGILAVVIANNHAAASASRTYAAAVEADSGAIKENIRLQAVKQLQDSGALDAAKKLKVSIEDVVDATLGNADAQKRLNAAVDAGENGSKKQQDRLKATGLDLVDYSLAMTTLTQGIESNNASIDGEILRYNERMNLVEANTAVTRAQQAADEAAAASLGISVGVLQEARNGQAGLTDSTARATAEMYIQGDAAGLLRQALDLLNGKALSAAEAQNRFESQLVNLPSYTDAAAASLEGMSETAVANRGSLLGLIQSSQDAALALRDQGASEDEVKQKMVDGKQAIIDQAAAYGMNRDEVTRFIDELYKVPSTIPKTKIEVDTANARAAVANFIADIESRRATVFVRAVTQNGSAGGFALGGTAGGMAGGGTAASFIRGLSGGGGTVTGPGTAGSDTAGLYRLANGEEVISNVFGQADRLRAQLKAINAGATSFAGMTAGSVRSASPSHTIPSSRQAAPVIVNVNVSVLKNEDPAIVGNQVGRGVREALAGVTV